MIYDRKNTAPMLNTVLIYTLLASKCKQEVISDKKCAYGLLPLFLISYFLLPIPYYIPYYSLVSTTT